MEGAPNRVAGLSWIVMLGWKENAGQRNDNNDTHDNDEGGGKRRRPRQRQRQRRQQRQRRRTTTTTATKLANSLQLLGFGIWDLGMGAREERPRAPGLIGKAAAILVQCTDFDC